MELLSCPKITKVIPSLLRVEFQADRLRIRRAIRSIWNSGAMEGVHPEGVPSDTLYEFVRMY
ncbi:MAG: hypothetical protein N3D11_10765 [Candidatus Sumerlaeia bacterium]|nr:hypothetical protein [Candidatus Sumerlaeia bacterium]